MEDYFIQNIRDYITKNLRIKVDTINDYSYDGSERKVNLLVSILLEDNEISKDSIRIDNMSTDK